ncbi:MAG TPA: hypothetical protein VFV81_09065 [Verrucomicrobiae bacterium]|nr:hypothetical protein [Verrucomicrobiae bacterium]
MEDLIIAVLQGIFEFLLEIFSYTPLDWPFTWTDRGRPETLWGKCAAWFIAGGGIAGVILLFWHRTWISHPLFRILNLITAPIISAFLAEWIAKRRNLRNLDVVPRNHFWQAFWFTLGIVSVRFAYAVRI